MPKDTLQTQIDIIRGRRAARPSGGLRILENNILGPRQSRPDLETQRWSHPSLSATALTYHAQACLPGVSEDNHALHSSHSDSETTASVAKALNAIVSPFDQNMRDNNCHKGFGDTNQPRTLPQNSQAVTQRAAGLCSPFSMHNSENNDISELSDSPDNADHAQQEYQSAQASLAPNVPEFTAPGQTRFEVEPFDQIQTDGANIESSTPATSAQAPIHAAATSAIKSPISSPISSSITSPINTAVSASAFDQRNPWQEDAEDADWIAQAQADQPKEITNASKKSLDAGLAFAKDDFERELASILGTTPQPTTDSAADDGFLQQAADAQSKNAIAANKPTDGAQSSNQNAPETEEATPAHPNHDVFDRMGFGLQYANSFDLGQININDRFDDIEQALSVENSTQPVAAQPINANLVGKAPDMSEDNAGDTFANPFVTAEDLDDFDLVAELAQIGAALPVQGDPSNNQAASKENEIIEAAGIEAELVAE